MKTKNMFTCQICKKEFYSKWGPKKTCSPKCLKEFKSTDEYKKNLTDNQKSTFLKKYGVDNPAKNKDIKEKTKNTCIERFGFVSPTLNAEIRKKQINSCLEKYGTETPLGNKTIFKKAKNTLKENFGVDCPWNSEEIKTLSRNTKMERYGDENYNNPNKSKETSLKRYGVESPTQLEEIKNKVKSTNLKKYGVEYLQQSEKFKEKSRKTNLEKYGVDNAAKSSEVKKITVDSNIKKYGVDYPMMDRRISKKSSTTSLKNNYNNIILKKYAHVAEPLFSEAEYIGNISWSKKYPFKCIKCNNKFEDTICSSHIPRCPICYPLNSGTSLIEKEISKFVKELLPSEVIIENDKKILNGQELDIYIPNKKIAIELNGNYWHSEISGKKYKNYHLNKTNHCESIGLKLIHIFEDEWINNQGIIKNKLIYLLSNNKVKKIYGRKCIIKEISSEESTEFLNRVHLQGSNHASIRLGAFHNNVLVAVCTFGKNRIALGASNVIDNYELYRFCSDGCITGILSKFLKYFIKTYNPKKITTYADRRYSNVNDCGYSKCGFTLVGATSPNYWYMHTKNNMNREHRFQYRKHELSKKLTTFDPTLTEWENMQINGYDRIWDCGHLKYEMDLS